MASTTTTALGIAVPGGCLSQPSRRWRITLLTVFGLVLPVGAKAVDDFAELCAARLQEVCPAGGAALVCEALPSGAWPGPVDKRTKHLAGASATHITHGGDLVWKRRPVLKLHSKD